MKKMLGLFLGLSMAGSSVFADAVRCEYALLYQDLTRELKSDYVERFFTNNKNKVVEVTDQAPIINQGTRGFCHMYSLYAEMVREYKARNNGQDPNISIYYWTYFHWLQRAISTAQNPQAGLEIPEGSWYENSFDIIKHAGVVTNETWTRFGGKTDIQTPTKNLIELGQLKTLVERAHLEKSLVSALIQPLVPKGQTRGDYFRAILDNPVVRQQIRNLVQRKQRELPQSKTQLTAQQIQILKKISEGQLQDQDMSPNEVSSFIANLNSDIAKAIETEFNLMYFGQFENPLGRDNADRVALAQKMFPEVMQKTISFITDGARKGRAQFLERQEDHLFFRVPLDNMEKIVRNQIDHNNSVWIGYDHNSYYADNKTGALTLEGMISLPLQPNIPRSERDLMNLAYGGHAVQIVGYELNEKNEIVAFKIQNSWGTESGNKGYYRMDMSYFRSYIWRITLRDEAGQFNEQAIQALKKISLLSKRRGRLPQ